MPNPVTRPLVLYTGGTIGMQQTDSGWAPASGFEQRMRQEQLGQKLTQLPPWTFQELSPPLDSANMGQPEWLRMRDAIVQAVQHGCDAVLVLHGTDTLAHSAAALSFQLLGLAVPVLLTGAMQPAGVPGGDAWPNVFGALQALHQGVANGVWIFFDGHLLRGTRTSKQIGPGQSFGESTRKRDAASAGKIPDILSYRRRREPVNLAVLPLYPGISAAHLQALLNTGVQGLILECYGSGSGPSENPDFLRALRQAHGRGTVLLAISQCPFGYLNLGNYAAAGRFKDAGLVAGGGLTREAALGKLFSLLGAGLGQAEVEHWLPLDFCGELRDG